MELRTRLSGHGMLYQMILRATLPNELGARKENSWACLSVRSGCSGRVTKERTRSTSFLASQLLFYVAAISCIGDIVPV